MWYVRTINSPFSVLLRFLLTAVPSPLVYTLKNFIQMSLYSFLENIISRFRNDRVAVRITRPFGPLPTRWKLGRSEYITKHLQSSLLATSRRTKNPACNCAHRFYRTVGRRRSYFADQTARHISYTTLLDAHPYIPSLSSKNKHDSYGPILGRITLPRRNAAAICVACRCTLEKRRKHILPFHTRYPASR